MRALTHLSPNEAVDVARKHDDRDKAAQRLDRYLLARLLDYLQNSEGDLDELSQGLLAARSWAVREVNAFLDRWSFLLEILEDSRRVPATAEQLAVLTERESSMLAQIILDSAEDADLRPKDLAERLGISEQNVNNYLRRMESQGLVARHQVPGKRAVMVFPTRRGLDLASQLKLGRPAEQSAADRAQDEASLAPEVMLWHFAS